MNDETKHIPTFVDCIIKGDVKNAERHIKSGSLANAKTSFRGRKRSMIEIAIQNDDIEMIKLLLNNGATFSTDFKKEEYLYSRGLLKIDPSKIIRESYIYIQDAFKSPDSQFAKIIFKTLGEKISKYDYNGYSVEKSVYFPKNFNEIAFPKRFKIKERKEIIDLFIDIEKNNFPKVLQILEDDQSLINAEIKLSANTKKFTLLDCAIMNMSIEIATYLINHKAKYNLSEEMLIANACKCGNLDFLKTMDSIGFNVTKDISNGLSTAILNGDTEMINFFIEKKVKLRLCHIITACENGSVELVRHLLDNGAPLQEGSISALAFPCQKGQLDIVKLFLSKGVNVTIGRGKVLNSACVGGNAEIVELILKSGADPNTAPIIEGYPIEVAASVGKVDIIEKLLSYGAELKNKGKDAIIAAAANGHINVVKFLADMGVDIKENLSAIISAASINGHIEIVKMLIELIPKDEMDKIATSAVVGIEHPEIMKLFMDKGFDIRTHHLLETAIHSNYLRVVKFLLENGFEVKESDLIYALETNSYELEELFLNYFNREDYVMHIPFKFKGGEQIINLLEKYGVIIVSTHKMLWDYYIQNEKYENITRAVVNGFNHRSLYDYLGASSRIPTSILYSIQSFIDPYSGFQIQEIINPIKNREFASNDSLIRKNFSDTPDFVDQMEEEEYIELF